eukprot:jgi/Astpho2/2715/fgenesh1_pg.00050_%23_29_t
MASPLTDQVICLQFDVFSFFPEELEAVATNFYTDLWQAVRMHTPKTSLKAMSADEQAVAAMQQEIEAVIDAHAEKSETLEQDINTAARHLRLQACCFRRSVRKASQQVIHSLRRAGREHPGWSAEQQEGSAAQAVQLLVGETCQVIANLQEEVWLLVHEFLLAEAERALLKLLRDLDKAFAPGQAWGQQSEPLSGMPSRQSTLDAEVGAATAAAAAAARGSLELQPEPQRVLRISLLDADHEGRELEHISIHTGQQEAVHHHVPTLATIEEQHSRHVEPPVSSLQRERLSLGFTESVLMAGDPNNNEKFTNRIKILKHNARAAVTLHHQVRPPSTLAADTFGMVWAAIAMVVAVGTVYAASYLGAGTNPRNQARCAGHFAAPYLAIIVVGYVLKDRIKEWGKRYLQPLAGWFGVDFPDRRVRIVGTHGQHVGHCMEWVRITDDTKVDRRVLELRHRDKGFVPAQRHATKPERVMAYRKKVEINWRKLDPKLQGVNGLDDLMSFDLRHFCRMHATAA